MLKHSWMQRSIVGGLLVTLILFAGCGGSSSSADSNQGAPAEASPAESNQAAPPAVNSTPDSNCDVVYLPVVKGATWSYAGSGSSGNYTRVDTITDVGNESFQIETRLPTVTYAENYKCTPAGLVNMQTDGGEFGAIFQKGSGTVKIKTVSVSGVTIPAIIREGDAWSQSTEIVESISGQEFPGSLVYDFKAVAPGNVTVPAGDIPVMQIDFVATMKVVQTTTTFSGTQWYSPGTGLVKMVGSGTIDMGNGMALQKFDSNFDMTSHNLP